MPAAPNIDNFVGKLQRRLGMARGIERVGLFLACGCAAAVVAIPLGDLIGAPVWWLTVWILSASAIMGLVMAWRAWPTRLTAAIEGDRQFKQDDLLSTAWSLGRAGGVTDSAAASMLLLEAGAACRTWVPSMLIARRWGAARWGGLAIGMALVLTVSAWWSVADSSGREVAAHMPGGFLTPKELRDERPTSPQLLERGATPEGRGETKTNGRFPDDTSSARTAGSSHPETSDAPPGHSHTAEGEGPGTGSAQSESRDAAAAPLVGSQTSTDADRPTEQGETASFGSGGQSDEIMIDNEAKTGESGVVTDTVRQSPPPWKSSQWTRDQASATAAIRAGRVPDAYLDLVRAYFDQQTD